MPRLQQYTSQLSASGTVRPATPSGVDLSGLAGGLAGASNSMQRLRQHEEVQANQLAEDEARVTIANTISQAHSTWTEKLQAAKQSAPDGAPNFTADTLKEFDAWSKSALDTAPQRARNDLQIRLAGFRNNMHASAFEFETRARQSKLATDFDTGLDADARTVWADPSQFTQVAANRLSLAGSLLLQPDMQSKLKTHARETLAYQAALGSTERDPDATLEKLGMTPGKWQPGMPLPDTGKALDAVKNDPILSNLPPEKMQTVLHRALSLSAARDAAGRTAADKAQKDAEKALKELREFSLTGQLASPDYQQQVLAQTAAVPELQGMARALLNQSVSGAAFGSQSLPDQAASLRALDARSAAGGTSPDEQKIAADARAITQHQTKAYAENPWAAATRFHRMPPTPEVEIASADIAPQLVAQRLQKIGDVEARSGKPESPLQPKEAEQYVSRLAALPVPERAASLSQTGALLSTERIGALADQLGMKDKAVGLAMKLGADKTNTGRAVAEFALRGSQALADKTVKKDDTALDGWRAEIAGMVRGTLGDARAEQDAIDAAYYVRAALDDPSTAIPGYKLDASNEAAVRMVLGQPVERAGIKTVLPRGMTESDFTSKLRAFTPEALKSIVPGGQVYTRGQPRTLDQLSSALASAGMKRDAQGRYLPVSGGAFISLDPEGQIPLRLEIK